MNEIGDATRPVSIIRQMLACLILVCGVHFFLPTGILFVFVFNRKKILDE